MIKYVSNCTLWLFFMIKIVWANSHSNLDEDDADVSSLLIGITFKIMLTQIKSKSQSYKLR